MRPEFITHVKEAISFTFKLNDVSYMKHQHATLQQKQLFVVYINVTLKIFFDQHNFEKLHALWTSAKPMTAGKVLTLTDSSYHD